MSSTTSTPTIQATISANSHSYVDCVQRIYGSDNPTIFVRESSSNEAPYLDFIDLTKASGDPDNEPSTVSSFKLTSTMNNATDRSKYV